MLNLNLVRAAIPERGGMANILKWQCAILILHLLDLATII
eukprot:SAG31_NODE_18911_length_618_cov_1.356455_2_plen_39_part_01